MAVKGTDYEILLKMRADMAQAVNQLNRVQSELRKTSDSAATTATSTAKVSSALSTIETRAGRVGASLGKLRNVLLGAFAVHEIISFTKSMVDANTEAQKIQTTLTQVFGAAGAKEQFKFVSDAAQRLGLDLKSTAEGYAQLAASAQGTGVQTRDLQKLFIGLSESATVLHSSASDVNGVMVQLAQGISLGKLQMQDIRAIAQHLPGTMGLVGEAARRMGTDLGTALKSGGLDARRFIGILGDVLHERFGVAAVAASHSLNSELQRLHNTLFTLQTDGSGFADTMAEAIGSINTQLSDPAIQQSLRDLIKGFGDIAAAAVQAAAKIGQMMAGYASMARYAAFLKTGFIDPDQTLVQQENEFNALVAKRESLKRSLNDLTSTELKLGLGNHLKARLDEVTEQIRAAQDARKALQVAQGQAQQRAIDAGAGSVIDSILAPPGQKPGTTPPATTDKSGVAAAAKLARDAAAAQAQLTQSLVALQGQLDPAAAIYAKYNAAVKQATDEATLAKQAHGANAQAIDAQKQAVIDLAGQVRDAALDQLAEKDRQAWEALKRSFETPAQVRVDDALKQIQQLNDMLEKGVITAQQYHDSLQQIGQKSVAGALPNYQGLDATVGGAYGELQKNYDAQAALDAAYQAQKLALDKKFNDRDEAQHAAHIAALNDLDAQRTAEQKKIDEARGTLQLNAASELFGQLATLSSSHNRKMATIGKAAAIAQAIIATYKSANDAFSALASIPVIGPALGAAAAAAAIAAGLANVAAIRAQPVGGYSEGGYTGPGDKYQPAGVVHAGEVVWSQADIRRAGGVGIVETMRLRGYAEGGVVSPFTNAPSPAELGFSAPSMPRVDMRDFAANDAPDRGAAPQDIKVVVLMDKNAVADEVLNSPTGQKVIVRTVGDNPKHIQGSWRRG